MRKSGGKEKDSFRQDNECPSNQLEKKIIDLEKANQQLRILVEDYRSQFENVTDVIILVGADFNLLSLSPSVEKLLGYRVEDLINRPVSELKNIFTAESFQRATEKVIKVLRGEYVPAGHYDFITKDGTLKHVELQSSPLMRHGRIEGVISVARDITQRKEAEISLSKSEKKFSSIFHFNPDPIAITEVATGKIIDVNEAFLSWTGYSREEVIGVSTQDLHIWGSPEEREKIISELQMTGEVKNTEIFLRQKNGNIRQMLFSASFVEIDQERYLLTFAHDITQRKQAEEKLRREEQQFRALAEQTPDMIVLINRDIIVTYVNPAVERFLGRKKEEIIGSYLFNYPHPDDLDLVVDIFTTFFKDTNPNVQRAELRLCDKDGVWHTVDAVGTNLVRDNVAEAVIVNLRDITERQQMENELRASESNFRHSLDESPLGVRISTVEGETIYANKAILDIYEYGSIEELKKTSIKERYTPQSYAEFLERKKKRLKGEFGPLEYAISIVRKNGEIRHLQVFRKEIFWDGKKQAQIIYQDITERKRAEEKLQKTLESLKKAVGTTIQVLVSALEARDPYTSGHQTRSADVACAIAAEMGLSEETIEGIRMAGTIHDIGKLSIPAEILTKPTKLTNLEFSLIQEHPRSGYEMLKDVESPWALAEIVHQHHERMNGSGYPRKLKGNEILLEARILAVADVVEAMASHRPYRPSLGIEIALDEIEKNKGILYDSAAADACLKLFREKGYQL